VKDNQASATPSRNHGLQQSTMGMIKKLITSKISSAASGECVIIGVKLADAEAHAVRLFGLLLLLVSIAVLLCDWHHKATAEAATTATTTAKQSRRRRRSHASRK
jgi:urea transporter